MKVEINNKEQNNEIKFPCLMITRAENIYLIQGLSDCGNYYKGISLKHPSGFCYSDGWDKEVLTPFNGSITLSNE